MWYYWMLRNIYSCGSLCCSLPYRYQFSVQVNDELIKPTYELIRPRRKVKIWCRLKDEWRGKGPMSISCYRVDYYQRRNKCIAVKLLKGKNLLNWGLASREHNLAPVVMTRLTINSVWTDHWLLQIYSSLPPLSLIKVSPERTQRRDNETQTTCK